MLLEVGMGGNLDATNIINNTLLAVLVSISMDHMSFLGNTLSEIAEKKAGIIKEGSHVVTVRQKTEVMEVICEKCRSNHAECTVADAAQAQVVEEGVEGQTIIYEKECYRIPLAGIYQKENAVAALNALKVLDRLGFPSYLQNRKKKGWRRCPGMEDLQFWIQNPSLWWMGHIIRAAEICWYNP